MWLYFSAESLSASTGKKLHGISVTTNPGLSQTSELQDHVKHLLATSLKESTRSSYKSQWNTFLRFCEELSFTPLPASSETISMFIAFLHKENFQTSTIRTYLSAIGFYHKINSYENPVASYPVSKCLQGTSKDQALKRKNLKKPIVRLPITKRILHKLIHVLPLLKFDNYSNRMLKALFLLFYYASLRAGEAVKTNSTDNILRLENVERFSSRSKQGYLIRFMKFKHSKVPITLSLLSTGQKMYCPVVALDEYLKLRGQGQGYLFLKANGSPLTRNYVSVLLKICLKKCGYRQESYNTHSFRIGRTTDLAAANHSENLIKITGRWHSNAYKKYIKPSYYNLPH